MRNRESINLIIKQFSGQNNQIVIPQLYIKLTGDYISAALLNQIVYWSDRTNRTDGFFYKSYKEWEEEMFITERQVRSASKKLVALGVIETAVKKANGNPTVHYKVFMDKLADSILTLCKKPIYTNVSMEDDKMSDSLTKITTKNLEEEEAVKSTPIEKPNAFRFYEMNFGILGSYIQQTIGFWIDDFDGNQDVVIEALKLTIEAGAKFNYADSIMKDWHNKGVRTLADAQAAQMQFKREQERRTAPKGKAKIKDIDWDALKEESKGWGSDET